MNAGGDIALTAPKTNRISDRNSDLLSTPEKNQWPSPSTDDDSAEAHTQKGKPPISRARLVLIIFHPSMVNFFTSFTNGVITVGLPIISTSIDLPRSLYLWPSSVFGLTSGAVLLIAGSVADIIGAKKVELAGMLLLGLGSLACGLSETGIQLVVFRAIQGIALAMHLPASVAIIANSVPPGKARNVAFSCLGLSQPLGFSVGLVLSGVMINSVGWRPEFYLSAGATILATVTSYWALPTVPGSAAEMKTVWKRLREDVDWVGGALASGGLAMLAYVLAILSVNAKNVKTPQTASLLAMGVALLVAFPLWMHRRQRIGKPALIPNKLWTHAAFSSICIITALSWGVMNANEIFSSLYFQEVQNASTLTTSLYLLPNLITGTLINLTVGLFVDRIPARYLVGGSSILCALSPLFMTITKPQWEYWYLEFWAQIFAPVSGDVLFTVGLIIVSDKFSEKTQALAGAVFNTVAYFGYSLGVGICQAVAFGVMGSGDGGKGGAGKQTGDAWHGLSEKTQMKGYRAGYWTMFAYMLLCAVISEVGLRKTGKVGLKRE